MRDLSRLTTVLIAVPLALGGSQAWASWQDSGTASMPVTSGSLTSATGLTATPGCLLTVPQVTLSWTPTASTQATGYRVFRRLGAGSYVQIATVAGSASSGYVDSTVILSAAYTYYVQAYLGSWTADSSTASATAPALCL